MDALILALFQFEDEGIGIFAILLWLAVVVFVIAGLWKMFEKAGKPGWGAIVPIYNIILLLEIAGRPLWWVVLCLIPLVNLVITFLVCADVARKFGKGTGFALGLFFLGFIFFPVLGFGDAQYQAGA